MLAEEKLMDLIHYDTLVSCTTTILANLLQMHVFHMIYEKEAETRSGRADDIG